MPTSDPDLVLLARYRATGDRDAFGEIVGRYASAVFATCHRILHDPGNAEDAAQETFYRLMTRPHRVSTSLGGWLHCAATRLALDIRRSDISRRRREAAYEAHHQPDAGSWSEVAPQLDAAIAALPDGQRDLLVRHFLRGESQAELAVETGSSPATLSRRMKQAVGSLREELARRGVSVMPAALLNLLAQNCRIGATASLKAGLAKMSLYCAARRGSDPFSLTRSILDLPRSIYAVRWAMAAALLSSVICILAASALRHVEWPKFSASPAQASASAPIDLSDGPIAVFPAGR